MLDQANMQNMFQKSVQEAVELSKNGQTDRLQQMISLKTDTLYDIALTAFDSENVKLSRAAFYKLLGDLFCYGSVHVITSDGKNGKRALLSLLQRVHSDVSEAFLNDYIRLMNGKNAYSVESQKLYGLSENGVGNFWKLLFKVLGEEAFMQFFTRYLDFLYTVCAADGEAEKSAAEWIVAQIASISAVLSAKNPKEKN